jgi:hypothetical protein
MKCRQADVEDFLLAESDELMRRGILERHIRRRYITERSAGRRRQRGPGDSQHG